MKPLKDVLSKQPHGEVWDRIKLPWQVREPIGDAMLEPFENLWQFCEWLRLALRRHFLRRKKRNTP